MTPSGRRADGRAQYFEYADAFAQRGLAHEGLAGRPEQRPPDTPADVESAREKRSAANFAFFFVCGKSAYAIYSKRTCVSDRSPC